MFEKVACEFAYTMVWRCYEKYHSVGNFLAPLMWRIGKICEFFLLTLSRPIKKLWWLKAYERYWRRLKMYKCSKLCGFLTFLWIWQWNGACVNNFQIFEIFWRKTWENVSIGFWRFFFWNFLRMLRGIENLAKGKWGHKNRESVKEQGTKDSLLTQ